MVYLVFFLSLLPNRLLLFLYFLRINHRNLETRDEFRVSCWILINLEGVGVRVWVEVGWGVRIEWGGG